MCEYINEDFVVKPARKEVLNFLGIDQQRVDEDVETLKNWILLQPHLPDIHDDKRLEGFLQMSKFNMERTKRKLDMYYTVRGACPEAFENRDPLSPELQNAMQVLSWIPLPKLTPKYERVTIFRLINLDARRLDSWECFKYIMMVCDFRIRHDYWTGEHLIFDTEGVKLNHAAKLLPSIIMKALSLVRDGYGLSVRGIHIINTKPFLMTTINMVKRILKEKLAQRIHIHENTESLIKLFPPDIIPIEYGGTEKPRMEIDRLWKKEIINHRQWFLEDQRQKVDETKRPEKFTENLFGSMHGSFRKLNID